MHKKIAADLVSIAHRILQLKNKDNIYSLHTEIQDLYEKITVLKNIEEYILETPNQHKTQEELLEETSFSNVKQTTKPKTEAKLKEEVLIKPTVKTEPLAEKPKAEKQKKATPTNKTSTLKEELKDFVSADVTTSLFENAKKVDTSKKSLNDILNTNIQIDLNDRIAFVKNLFNGSQEDFNRVLSQLNSFEKEKEAINFVKKMVKPEYNWTNQEQYEERLINLIERKFA